MIRSYLVHEIVKQISTKYLYEVHYQTLAEANVVSHQSLEPFQEDIYKAISERFCENYKIYQYKNVSIMHIIS